VPDKKSAVNLRTVADRVGLAPCSVSAILNNTPASQAIPQATKDRVFRAASELNYRPNLWARSLRTKRTGMVAVIAPDFGRGAIAKVIAGAQSRLHNKGYLLALATPAHSQAGFESAHFQQRGIEGLIAVDTDVSAEIELPVAAVELDYVMSSDMAMHDTAAWLSALGEAAAEAIIRQVESENISRRINVDAKLPAALFDLPSAGSPSRAETRERA
jgi:DNA-binding LacI/PurR family transcriptional regulator